MTPYPTSPFGRAHFYPARIYTWHWHSIIGNLHSCKCNWNHTLTAVSFMAPPHNGLDTPWPKFMLDSLRCSRTFPRREDCHFSTSSAYTQSAWLSYTSTWQPYTWTFVGTWCRAASLAAGEGSLSLLERKRHHPSYFWNERDGNGECSQPGYQTPGVRAVKGSHARSRLSVCCCWPNGLGYMNDTLLWYLVYGTFLAWNQKITPIARQSNPMPMVSHEYNIASATSWKWNNGLGGMP